MNVFARTACYMARHEGSLHLLSYVDTVSTLNDAPSWIPDWKAFDNGLHLFSMGTRAATKHSPYPSRLQRVAGDRKQHELKVAALRQDTIKFLEHYNEDFKIDFFGNSISSDTYRLTSQLIHVAVKQMLIRHAWGCASQAASAAFLELEDSTESAVVPPPFGLVPPVLSMIVDNQIRLLQDEFDKRDPDYKVFCGQNGMIGYGPKNLQMGDEIHLLLGIDMPVALRPTESGYRYQGVCYVHGLMHGEGLHSSRRPRSCYYPGSSTVNEPWVLSSIEQREMAREQGRMHYWLEFESREQAIEHLRSNASEMFSDGFIQDPLWSPDNIAFGEQ